MSSDARGFAMLCRRVLARELKNQVVSLISAFSLSALAIF